MFIRVLQILLLVTLLLIYITTNAFAHGGSKNKSQAESKNFKLQTMCPVTGKALNKSIFSDCNGQRIYFSDENSKAKFDFLPKFFINKMKSEGIMIYHMQTQCPVNGDPIDRNIFVEHEGNRIFSCRKKCQRKIKNRPDKYVKKLMKQGVILEDVIISHGTEGPKYIHENSHHNEHHDHQH